METTVKVTCSDGDHWTTGINLDFAGARDYFMGQRIVREDFETGKETYTTVIKVEEITQ